MELDTTLIGVVYPEQKNDVRDLQKKLRTIGFSNESMPMIIPDGIFGNQTVEGVKTFQSNCGIEPTGVVDYETWNKIVDESKIADSKMRKPKRVMTFPDNNISIYPGEKSILLYVIQSMMFALSEIIDDIEPVEINGIHDEKSVNIVKKIQGFSGIDANGIIDNLFMDNLALLYEVYVSSNRV